MNWRAVDFRAHVNVLSNRIGDVRSYDNVTRPASVLLERLLSVVM